MEPVAVSVVIPVFNEANRIERAVKETASVLREAGYPFEILIAEDGSTDGSDQVASGMAREYPFVLHLHSPYRLGRGEALKRAFRSARGEIVGYMDSDLATDVHHLPEFVARLQGSWDVLTGSRMVRGSQTHRPLLREFTSRSYNLLGRILYPGFPVHDLQCGFKFFRREVILKLLEVIEDQGWFWDSECLVRAWKGGYRVGELPVRWTHGGASKVSGVKDSWELGSKLVRLRFKRLASPG